MKKLLIITILTVLLCTACGQKKASGSAGETKNPPPLYVYAGEESAEALLGGFSWTYKGTMAETKALSPLMRFDEMTPLKLNGTDTISFSLDGAEYICCWSAQYAGSEHYSDGQALTIDSEGKVRVPTDGTYIYQVDFTLSQGQVSYYFATE